MGARSVPFWPRMMRRTTAALYCDLTPKDFEREVIAGRLPVPVTLGGSEHWSRPQLDEHLERLTGESIPDWRQDANFYKERKDAAA